MIAKSGTSRVWWASLGVKLFASYLVVAAIGIGTLVVAASLATPSFFDLRMAQMMGIAGPGRRQAVGMMGQARRRSARVARRWSVSSMRHWPKASVRRLAMGCYWRVWPRSRRLSVPVLWSATASSAKSASWLTPVIASRTGSTPSFDAMAGALEATEQRRAELTGDVSHELRMRCPRSWLRNVAETYTCRGHGEHHWDTASPQAARPQSASGLPEALPSLDWLTLLALTPLLPTSTPEVVFHDYSGL
jgi:hypothetical protein